jgi:hypothetical protein
MCPPSPPFVLASTESTQFLYAKSLAAEVHAANTQAANLSPGTNAACPIPAPLPARCVASRCEWGFGG